MKKIFLIITVLACNPVYSQRRFEGLLLYKYEFQDLNGNDIREKMKDVYGLEQHYYVSSYSYKTYNEKGELTQLYNPKKNIYFYRINGKLRSASAATELPKEFSLKQIEDTEKIMGHDCHSVVVNSEHAETKYFISDEITVNPIKYHGHRFGNWNKFLESTKGALPLKYVMKREDFVMIATVVEIKRMDLERQSFKIENAIQRKQ